MKLGSSICFLNRHNSKNNTFKMHSHDCYEIIYFSAGTGKVIIDDKEYKFYPNSYCLIAPNSKHVEHIDGAGEVVFIGFKTEEDKHNIVNRMHYKGANYICKLMDDIMLEYQNQYTEYKTASKALLTLLLIYIERNCKSEKPKCVELDYIREYIFQHSNQKIDFKELSQMSGYSYDYFRHLFKETYAVSPQEYLISTRVDKAKELFMGTTLSCTEISYLCGFSNSAQMSAMFKKRYGKTPVELKKAKLYNHISEG